MTTIVKRKTKAKCRMCLKWIAGKYMVELSENRGVGYYHLSCLYTRRKVQLEILKKELKLFNKTKIKRQIVLEEIEKQNEH